MHSDLALNTYCLLSMYVGQGGVVPCTKGLVTAQTIAVWLWAL
jgi:hypothetical protein